MEVGDWTRLDRALGEALRGWRRRSAELAALAAPLDVERDPGARELATSPIPVALVHEEVRYALKEAHGDPLACALRPWVETFWLEQQVYPARVEVAEAWGVPRPVRGRSVETSARALRREILSAPQPALRARAADDLFDDARSLADRTALFLESRLEREQQTPPECRALAVAELAEGTEGDASNLVRLAWRLLEQSDEPMREFDDRTWLDSVRRAVGVHANAGWPARPTARWLAGVFGTDELTRGLDLGPLAMPRAIGASSYARALGSFGMRLLEAARPRTMPFAMHQHPNGLRKHATRSLFASVVADESFAARTLGLGKGEARRHRRDVFGAFVMSLRIDAMRVLVHAALRSGADDARERARELGERVFGRGMPRDAFGVLPTMRPGDGVAFVGALDAHAHRERLVADHDEDWFRNPRALAELRARLGVARDAVALDLDALIARVDAIGAELVALLG